MGGLVYLFVRKNIVLKNIILIFFILLCLLNNNINADTMIIDNMNDETNSKSENQYCENSDSKWCFVSDKVMGGVSEGSLVLKNEDNIKFYKMKGDVSTKNNGGFIQFRTEIKNHPSGKLYKGIRLKVRGNSEEYAVHIRTKYLFLPWQYYEAKFMTKKEWVLIDLPLVDFAKSNFYQPSSISSTDIKTIGIVAIGRDFSADVDLAFIELY